MNDIVNPTSSFEESIKNKLRENIGELMPDGVLTKMIEKTLHEMFFTKEVIKNGYYSERTGDSWFEKEVKVLLKDKINSKVSEYLDAEADKLVEIAAKGIAEQAPNLLASVLISSFSNNSNSFSQTLTEWIRNKLMPNRN